MFLYPESSTMNSCPKQGKPTESVSTLSYTKDLAPYFLAKMLFLVEASKTNKQTNPDLEHPICFKARSK